MTRKQRRAEYHAAKQAARYRTHPSVSLPRITPEEQNVLLAYIGIGVLQPRNTFRFVVEGVGIQRFDSIETARIFHPGRVVRRAKAND